MKWLKCLFGPSAYNQGYLGGFKEGLLEGKELGHEHGACEHTHPFDDALRLSGFGTITGRIYVRGPEMQDIPYDKRRGY
ncbi:hypothetical protein LCGC14_2394720 [marine sediment metagenome]|uniref:Uncharacterized protein n=1 Tax=marine sediment metagenome TaxID=412755 RepID=A0A0F9CJ70_9ZZZZ